MNVSRTVRRLFRSWILVAFVFSCFSLVAQQGDRETVPDRYKWNVKDIFPTPEAWQAEKDRLGPQLSGPEAFKGTLDRSPQHLQKALDAVFALWRELDKLYVYAYLNSIQDLRLGPPQVMLQEVERFFLKLNASLAFLEPEILAIPADRLAAFVKAEPRLHPYRNYLQGIQRGKPHTFGVDQEWIISKAGTMAGVGGNIHDVFTNAELPWKKIPIGDGTEALINIPGYESQRTSADRSRRIETFDAFYSSLGAFRGTFAALLNSKIKENLFYRDVRKYDDVLDMYLFPRKIPRIVYTGLIESVHQALPSLHRYLKLKRRMLGLEKLHYHDLYPEWIPGTDVSYTFPEAQSLLEKSLGALGPEYGAFLRKAFTDRWIDVFPSPGKLSGASCEGSFDTHPFVKLNYNGRFGDISMAAHELGHAVHSCFSNLRQSYATSGINSLIAETAATVNASLLSSYVVDETTDPKRKMALIGNVMETFRQTLFRQCLFAEFEFRIHQMAEEGKSLSADDFDRIYLELLKTYYGHDLGVVEIDDLYKHEWCYIAHYFIGYYHYFYSTSFIAANAIAENVKRRGAPMLKDYIQFLSSGNTVDPIPLLQSVGVDMTSPRPMEDTIRLMNRYLDIAENIAIER